MNIKEPAHPKKCRCYAIRISSLFLSVIFVCIVGTFNPASSYFTTQGQNIVERANRTKVVALHGFSIGGWLVQEGYQWGSTKNDRSRLMEQGIIDLIGKADADSFWNIYHANFFIEQDIKDLKGWGVNAIRPALLGHLIQPRDGQPAKPPYNYNPEGWRLLDSLVAWCDRWGVGIIWDMHAGPGSPNGQLYSDAPGGSATLWSDTATTWPRTRDLWFKIADRYKTRPCIVGYDFENEPLLSNMGYNPALLRKLFVQLTDTIRTVDTVGIMFVEGQWYARDFSILEPLNWDKHLVLSYHEYNPMITSCNNMKGSQNGFSWDVCAARTKYNIPVWIGETGAKPPPYTINAQSTDFFNANNFGWSWWDHKNFVSQNQPWYCPKTSGFQTILDYWNNGGTKPSAANARTWLLDQARRTNRSYCTFQPNMVSSLHPLNPNGVVSVQSGPAQKASPSISVSKRGGTLLIEMPKALDFSVKVISSNGQMVKSGRGCGGSWQYDCSGQTAGLYFVKIASLEGYVIKRLVITR